MGINRRREMSGGREGAVAGGRARLKREDEADSSYPTCLAYLNLLQSPLFRERLRDPIFAQDIQRIGARHHETWYVPLFSSGYPSIVLLLYHLLV